MIKITIVCSSKEHPIYPKILEWKQQNQSYCDIELLTTVKDIKGKGDILFLVSCSEIVKKEHRDLFDYCLVIHASDLPNGRGWSPHIWAVLDGQSKLCVSLLNAEDEIDSGDIWKKVYVKLDGTELYNEINELLFKAELELMDWAVHYVFISEATPQTGKVGKYLRKRTPEDSELNVQMTIAEQINLLRVCDPARFPAYFYLNNQKYIINIEKV